MATASAIRAQSQRVDEAYAEIGRTLPSRSTADGLVEWQRACRVFWSRLDDFVSLVGLDTAAVRAGDTDAVERAIALLEADPRCHRSGYQLERAASALANAPLSPSDRARLRAVVVHQVQQPRARMMRPTARLASAVEADALDDALQALASRDVDLAASDEPRWGPRSDISTRVAVIRAEAAQRTWSEVGRRIRRA